jgi:cell division septation protein DedD
MGKKIKKYKVGTDSETYAISMVEQPAIEVDYVALAKQEEVEVKLSSDERHICYGPALIPNKDIYRNNGEQEFYINFTEESIVKMSQDFMKEYRQKEVTLDHESEADEVYIVESWLVEDPYKDKANALGFNVPKNTWMIGMKVNNIEVWDRVKAGELKGFSVESMISLEEFSKIDNNMEIKTDDMGFWTKMKEILEECFSSPKVEEPVEIEPTNIDLEAEPAPVAEPAPEPVVEEPKPEPAPVVEEPKPEPEPQVEPEPAPAPEPQDNHLEELINSLKEEIAALKESNGELNNKLKEMSKQPSAAPVNVNAKPNAADTYSAWRKQMASYLGY